MDELFKYIIRKNNINKRPELSIPQNSDSKSKKRCLKFEK